jgi:hypothetical protein
MLGVGALNDVLAIRMSLEGLLDNDLEDIANRDLRAVTVAEVDVADADGTAPDFAQSFKVLDDNCPGAGFGKRLRELRPRTDLREDALASAGYAETLEEGPPSKHHEDLRMPEPQKILISPLGSNQTRNLSPSTSHIPVLGVIFSSMSW